MKREFVRETLLPDGKNCFRMNRVMHLAVYLWLLFSGFVFAGNFSPENVTEFVSLQQDGRKIVTGRVVDAAGESIIGANVVEKETANGTITDRDGNFSLSVAENVVLQISYIGYLSREIEVGNQSHIRIVMEEDLQMLDEVVVVGYGTQKKINLTGAVATIAGQDMVKRPVTNATTMLQGQVPGLTIVQGTGQPGSENVSMRIRGQGTYSNAGSDPLVLIDGVPGNLSTLNANDIENVSVLKDASSAAIYGARAANGVILVTTKTGQEDQFKLAYNLNLGIHTPTRMFDLITNSVDYMKLNNEAMQNSGIASASNTYSDEMIALYENATDRVKYPNFDWMDYAFNPALVQNHDLSISGGARGTTYNISLGYIDQPGTLMGYGFKKYNLRINLKSKVKDWAVIGANLFMERGDVEQTYQGQDEAVLSFMSHGPTYGPKVPGTDHYTGSAWAFEFHNKNQVAVYELGMTDNRIDYESSAQLWAEISLFKGLTWYTKGAVNFSDKNDKYKASTVHQYSYLTDEFLGDMSLGSGLSVTNARTFYTNFYSYLQYETTVSNDHHASVQIGYNQETNRYDFLRGQRQSFLIDGIDDELNAAVAEGQQTSGTANQWALLSFFGRLTYDYKSRYLLEANARYDGTSRMPSDLRWGLFPSFSGGWRLSEESFFKNLNVKWIDNLKIRGSYGLLGNQNIGNYPYQPLLAYTGNYPFDNSLTTGVAQTAFFNRNIKWESTSVYDIGLDIAVFKGLSVSYDYYRKKTTDILRGFQITDLLGLSAPTVNSGAMINYGHEIAMQYTSRIKEGRFRGLNYGGSVYFNTFKNEAANFGTEEISGNYIRKNGYPYNSLYVLDCIGVFQTQEEIDNSPRQFSDGVVPGDLKYRDVDGNGIVDNDDRIILPGKFPDFDYAVNLYASWKGFDFSAFFQGVEGLKTFAADWGVQPFRQGASPTKKWLTERWTGPGTSNWYPRITWDTNGNSQNRRASTWYIWDSSYLRLKNLTFGYTLPKSISSHIKAEKIRAYFSGDNLFTVTPFEGLDPERPNENARLTHYPQSKIISFGVNVEF
jgi:TonB-linked SusC/RagA family outer membrane protein